MNNAKSFKQSYDVLARNAKILREQREPNIDDLLKIVTESMDAYNICKERIDAVEKALAQTLGADAKNQTSTDDKSGIRSQRETARHNTAYMGESESPFK